MSDYNINSRQDGVPVRADRVFDSCSDKDCLTDLRVTITDGELPPGINIVRSRAATVENVCVNVEPVPFNKGFYSIDLTFTFSLEILGYENARTAPVTFTGTCYASKNCILYGSESSVRMFSSNDDNCVSPAADNQCGMINLPTASVSVLEPIVLETRITGGDGGSDGDARQRGISVTLGLFSVVELTRPVTLLVPTYDYTIPRKECCTESDSPCEVFDKLKFPEEEFSPISLSNSDGCDDLDEAVLNS